MLFPGKKEKTNRILAEQIILKKYNQYYRLAYSYTHNDADACDIVQNGAFKAIRNSHTLNHPEYAETWIYRIMLNECFVYKKMSRCLSYEALQEESRLDAGVMDRYENVDLQRAMFLLPDSDRAVLILKYFETNPAKAGRIPAAHLCRLLCVKCGNCPSGQTAANRFLLRCITANSQQEGL